VFCLCGCFMLFSELANSSFSGLLLHHLKLTHLRIIIINPSCLSTLASQLLIARSSNPLPTLVVGLVYLLNVSLALFLYPSLYGFNPLLLSRPSHHHGSVPPCRLPGSNTNPAASTSLCSFPAINICTVTTLVSVVRLGFPFLGP
jgi:hypothetical protein